MFTGLVQYPWKQPDDGHHRREIRYEIKNSRRHFEVADYQVIDVLNDHLCYVITERKTAWFLPRSNCFAMVLKIVVTHVAKSHCRLTIFGRVEWFKSGLIGIGALGARSSKAFVSLLTCVCTTGLIDHQADAYLHSYATTLADIVSDQSSRLGVQGATSARRAINVFGGIGLQTESVAVQALDLAPADLKGSKRMRYRSLPRLVMYATRRVVIVNFFVVLGWILQVVKWMHTTVTANRVLVLMLLGSAGFNMFLCGKDSWEWWQERSAARYMSRLGVRPDAVTTKSIWLKDVEDMFASTKANETWVVGGQGTTCQDTFGRLVRWSAVEESGRDTGLEGEGSQGKYSGSTMARIKRSRRAFGEYRHDLLVALRLVGRVEQEVIRAEWENWVSGEGRRCKHAQRILQGEGSNKTEGLREWWDQYCPSCIGALAELNEASLKT
jgi:hypothetical protein